RAGFLPDREMLVGAVDEPLPAIPRELASFDCRNNRLALHALAQIHSPVAAAIERFGRSRVGVVAATSTSGSAETGTALRERLAGGALPPRFHYAQFEHGGLAAFIAASIGA